MNLILEGSQKKKKNYIKVCPLKFVGVCPLNIIGGLASKILLDYVHQIISEGCPSNYIRVYLINYIGD